MRLPALFAGTVLLALCATTTRVSAVYNGTCARELKWAPTPGKSSGTLLVGWPDGVPTVLTLLNATSSHNVHLASRYTNKSSNTTPGPVSQETHECIPLGTNKTLLVQNVDGAARIRLDPANNNTLFEPLPGNK